MKEWDGGKKGIIKLSLLPSKQKQGHKVLLVIE